MTRTDFNDLVRQQNRKLYGYAFRILRNQEEAEDAVQEVFIKLWNLGNKLDSYNSIGALATTMIKNFCIDQIRKKKHFNGKTTNVLIFMIWMMALPISLWKTGNQKR